LDSLNAEAASELEIFSMAFFPKNEESKFVRIKALKGNFPFYGKIKSDPADAALQFQSADYALVDEGLLIENRINIGDSIRLGNKSFMVNGKLQSAFGSLGVTSNFAPTVYISQDYIDDTKLVQPGSMVNYGYYYKILDDTDPDEWEDMHRKTFRDDSFRIETIEEQKEDLDEAFSNLNYFLNLIALVSLLLGCIGVASSVFIYIKNKISSIATFRCLGMTGAQAFSIFLIQISFLGLLSVLVGVFLGSAIQMYLPVLFKDFLPYEVVMDISWRAILEGLVVGLIMTFLFALAPLVGIRKISPLRTLRSSYEEDVSGTDYVQLGIYISIVLCMFIFLWQLTKDISAALIFTAGLLTSFAVLFFVSLFIMWFIRKYFPRNWNFVFRQGLSNLYRPNNQTQLLLVSIGLGTAILTTLFIIQGLILKNVDSMDSGNQPNMVLYGIENDQSKELRDITESFDLPVIQEVPIVTMKLAAWKGKTRAEWLADTTRRASRWAINREARVTYRDYLETDEKLLEGEFIGNINEGDSVYISLDKGYAESLDVMLGDELVWNVQGTMIKTYVSSFREIEFRSMRTRFFILFPNGVLEKAPQFKVVVTKSPDVTTTANYRREVVKAFPNISVVDLGMILSTLNDILNKVSYVIKFMAAFSILTGLIVLISSLLLSKFQRVKESVLLRTIGASQAQILKINATEYALLGGLSAATGIFISLFASFLLAKYQFELDFIIDWWPILAVFIFIVGLTMIIGFLNSQEVIRKSPLEVLRKEV